MNLFVILVRVKWGKQKFEAVELNTDEPPALFKMQLFSLSGSTAVSWFTCMRTFLESEGEFFQCRCST